MVKRARSKSKETEYPGTCSAGLLDDAAGHRHVCMKSKHNTVLTKHKCACAHEWKAVLR